MESEAYEMLRSHIEMSEQVRDQFYKYNTPGGDFEAMIAEKIIRDSLKCFIEMLSENDLRKKVDLMGLLFLSSAEIAKKRIKEMEK